MTLQISNPPPIGEVPGKALESVITIRLRNLDSEPLFSVLYLLAHCLS